MNNKVAKQIFEDLKEDLSSYSTKALEDELAARKAKKDLPNSFKVKFPLGKYLETNDIFNEIATALSKIVSDKFNFKQEVLDSIDDVIDNAPDLYDWEVSFVVCDSLGKIEQFKIGENGG